jgi:hypothetical protein
MNPFLMRNVAIGVLLAFLSGHALAQSTDNSRGVRIIDGPETPAAAPPPALEAPAAAPSAPLVPPPKSAVTAPPQMSPPPLAPPQAVRPPQAPAAPSVAVHPPLPTLETSDLAVTNPADLSIDILPGPHIPVGSRVSFRISTKRAGYLILLDVDSSGKLTQIYPNPASLLSSGNIRPQANFVKPGKPIQIPSMLEPFAGLEFVATPPLGTAMVVAVLSDQPVQIVDLPDIPMSIVGKASSLAFLSKLATDLRIPVAGSETKLQQPKWSFDAKFYQIAQAGN